LSLKDTIQADIKTALLGGNRFDAEVLRGLKAAILDEEVSSGARDAGLGDEAIEKVVAREVKKRRESARLYRENGREELAESEEKELAVLERYLPEQISEAELATLVDAAIVETGASGPQAMGQVIGAVKKQVGNKADGAVISRIVGAKLREQ
jgi:uncharacterized protein YqeY